MTADSQAVPQCAVPAVPDGSQPGPLDWPTGAHARRIGDTLERLNPRWAEVMDGRRSPWEQWVREQVCPRQTPAEAGERDYAGIWPQPGPRGRHAAPVTEPVPPMTRPYRIPEAAVICDECDYPLHPCPRCDEAIGHDDHQCGPPPTPVPLRPGTVPPPAEEVMPHGPHRDAQGRTRQLETAPRPGQEAEGISLPSITGPGRSDEDGDAEQFGPPDEPFWGKDKPRIEPPPETAEMTATTEQPGQEQS